MICRSGLPRMCPCTLERPDGDMVLGFRPVPNTTGQDPHRAGADISRRGNPVHGGNKLSWDPQYARPMPDPGTMSSPSTSPTPPEEHEL